jgi:hypothetical protein
MTEKILIMLQEMKRRELNLEEELRETISRKMYLLFLT